MRLFLLISAFLLSDVAAYAQLSPQQQRRMTTLMEEPLFETEPDYSEIEEIEGCIERTLGPPKYQVCRDSSKIYETTLAAARAKGLPLLVVFGFDTCPSCADMDRVVFDPKSPMTNNHLARYLSKPAINTIVLDNKSLKISVVRINSRSQHGLDLAADLGLVGDNKHTLASPTLLFVDPNSGQTYFDENSHPGGYCDWGAELAAGLEGVGYVQAGTPYLSRTRC